MASPVETKPGAPKQPGAARGGARAARLAVVGTTPAGAEPLRQPAAAETAEATIAAAVAEVVGVAAEGATAAVAAGIPAGPPRPAAADPSSGTAPRAAAADVTTTTTTTTGAAARGATTTLMESTMDQATKAAETFMKAAEDAAEFGRGNVEALTKATQVYVAGVQDLGRQTFALMQGLTDHALEGAKALAAVKSVQEAAQVQANYARAAIEKSVSEGTKLGESTLKLAEQSFAPITARVTLAVEKFGRAPSFAA